MSKCAMLQPRVQVICMFPDLFRRTPISFHCLTPLSGRSLSESNKVAAFASTCFKTVFRNSVTTSCGRKKCMKP